ncbi:MAG: hypothetical protein HOE90_06035 [Bacteriovoracaceae bacterium]|jgi:hypothetical protein|nr:hypothetical protein [Bacteriovoracaceae bacterium]
MTHLKALILALILTTQFAYGTETTKKCFGLKSISEGKLSFSGSFYNSSTGKYLIQKIYSEDPTLIKAIENQLGLSMADLAKQNFRLCISGAYEIDGEHLKKIDLVTFSNIGGVYFKGNLKAALRPKKKTPFEIELKLSVGGDSLDISDHQEKDGWFWNDDESAYVLKKKLTITSLPYSEGNGYGGVHIAIDGTISMGYEYGDYDGSASGSMTYPKDKNGFIALDAPMVFKVDGGEYASGSWNFDGELKIRYTK